MLDTSVITNLKTAMAKKYICNESDALYNSYKCDGLLPVYSDTALF